MGNIKRVDIYNFLGQTLDQLDDDWQAFLRNISKAQQVWGHLEKLLLRVGADPLVLEKFYRMVVRVVLVFGLETWVMLASMSKHIEGVHVGFLQKLWEEKARRQKTVLVRSRHRTVCSRKWRQNHSRHTITRVRHQWHSGYPYILFLRYAQRRRATREGRGTRSRGGNIQKLTSI